MVCLDPFFWVTSSPPLIFTSSSNPRPPKKTLLVLSVSWPESSPGNNTSYPKKDPNFDCQPTPVHTADPNRYPPEKNRNEFDGKLCPASVCLGTQLSRPKDPAVIIVIVISGIVARRRSVEKGVEENDGEAALVRALVEKTSSKEMSLELKQFCSLTSATSEGSANSMSTHCQRKKRVRIRNQSFFLPAEEKSIKKN